MAPGCGYATGFYLKKNVADDFWGAFWVRKLWANNFTPLQVYLSSRQCVNISNVTVRWGTGPVIQKICHLDTDVACSSPSLQTLAVTQAWDLTRRTWHYMCVLWGNYQHIDSSLGQLPAYRFFSGISHSFSIIQYICLIGTCIELIEITYFYKNNNEVL